jgi:hypothetical protein
VSRYSVDRYAHFYRLFIVALLLSVVSLGVVLLLTIERNVMDLLRIRPEYLITAILLHYFAYVVWGVRIKVLCKGVGHTVPFMRCLSVVFNNLLLSAITPSMAGGEPVRIHMLSRSGLPYGLSCAVIFGERVLDLLFILSMIPVSVMALVKSGSSELSIFLGAVGFLLLVIVIGTRRVAKKPKRVADILSKVVRFFERILGKGWIKSSISYESIERECSLFTRGIDQLAIERRYVVLGFITTIAYWFFQYSVLLFIVLGLIHVEPISILPHLIGIQVALTILLALPLTPGSSGVAEFGAFALFSYIVPYSMLGIVVLSWRLIHYYLDLFVGGMINFIKIRNFFNSQKFT